MQTNQNQERRADGYSTAQNEADGFEPEGSDHSFVCRKGTRSKSVSTSTTLIRIMGGVRPAEKTMTGVHLIGPAVPGLTHVVS